MDPRSPIFPNPPLHSTSEMARGDPDEPTDIPCCISHGFARSASRNPNRVAIVHATGGIRVCRELRAIVSRSGEADAIGLIEDYRQSCSPPSYRGDVCYTFGDVLRAVETLSVRIRRVLDGWEDPNVLRPKGFATGGKQQLWRTAGYRFPLIVGVCIAPSVEYIVCVLAILRCGEAFLPLDPEWPEDRTKSLIASSRTDLLVLCSPTSFSIGRSEATEFDWVLDKCRCSLLHFSMDACIQDELSCNGLIWPCEDDNPRLFCYLMYTSGSTGKPKGVCGTERGLVNRYVWMQAFSPLCKSDILLFKTSIIFIDHLQEFLAAMLTCTTLVIPFSYELKANPSYMILIIKIYHISRLTAVPSLMRATIPFLQSLILAGIQILSPKLLILSGETLSISLWASLCKLLPDTTILNLYGSSEVSGDCMYFDCSNLSEILKVEALTTVPIGLPISNCNIVILEEEQEADEGELCVGGSCLFVGYLDDLYLQVQEDRFCFQLHFRTGDFARRLPTGEYLFVGRKDRTLKLSGHRVSLEEIEDILRQHPAISNAAILHQKTISDHSYLSAHIVPKFEGVPYPVDMHNATEEFVLSIRKWLLRKLPLVMIPSKYIFIDTLPVTPSGKLDYAVLARSILKDPMRSQYNSSRFCHDHLEIIKEVFRDALLVEEVTELDDFFILGGNSMAAAQVANMLGIDMRLLYVFPSPIRLLSALYSEASNENIFSKISDRKRKKIQNISLVNNDVLKKTVHEDGNQFKGFASSETDLDVNSDKTLSTINAALWTCNFPSNWFYSFSRCNYTRDGTVFSSDNKLQACMAEIASGRNGFLQELWQVPLLSCVDASPLLLLKDGQFNLFIGSHSHIFLCIDAMSGVIRWEVKLDGRIECSAAMTDDFSQVVVGCYMGKVYFINCNSGVISWMFQTDGEVKMQPLAYNNLIWCGSHDHYLYALDYHNKSCVYKISCGGSVYGSPSIDTVEKQLYVASTSGRVTALCIEAPFCTSWLRELGHPIFGSSSLNPLNGNVIYGLVNGAVIALDAKGSIIWKVVTGGPIFAGACISVLLPSQVIACSRNGIAYAFDLGNGELLWEYNAGSPITAAAYVDEHIELKSDPPLSSGRFVCICSSSGSIHVLRVNLPSEKNGQENDKSSKLSLVELFAKVDLPGDIFSSPVMIGGRIFIGCRDDYIHCLQVVQ